MKLPENPDPVRFAVHAKPRAKKSQILGRKNDALEVSLAAPPADGEANAELVRVLAEALGVPKKQVTIARGASSRTKIVEVTGVTIEQVRSRLDPSGVW
jgi:uncharacterized protein (TIGR00251 family)